MTFKRAIVTAVGPLRILIDGDTVPIPFTPKSLIDPATLTVDDVVHADQSGHRLLVLGRSGGLGLVSGRNLIINGGFRTNQRGYVSGTGFGSTAYSFDRWALNGTLTFTALPAGQAVTMGVGSTVDQFIEIENGVTGDHVLSWAGTALGIIGWTLAGVAGSTGYLSSPVTVTIPAGVTQISVRLYAPVESDTGSEVKFERGSIPTPFELPPIGEELAACYRYYWRLNGSVTNGIAVANGALWSSTEAFLVLQLPVTMRAKPTMTHPSGSSSYGVYSRGGAVATDNISLFRAGVSTAELYATSASMGTVGDAAWMRIENASGWLAFDAEL